MNIIKELIQTFFLHLDVIFKKMIIIYQMGKVGSTTIYNSLKKSRIGKVLHTHRLNPVNIKKILNRPNNRNSKIRERSNLILHRSVTKKQKPTLFISLFRDPIERNISAFFQNFEYFTGNDFSNYDLNNLEEIMQIFINNYDHEIPLNWFDTEIKQVLGIDVFSYTFPMEVGYQIIENDKFKLLLIQTELEDSIKEDAIKKFFGIEEFALCTAKNVASDKKYAALYQEFKNRIKLPTEYISLMYKSKYMQHFYSKEDIKKRFEKWIKKSDTKNRLPEKIKTTLNRYQI